MYSIRSRGVCPDLDTLASHVSWAGQFFERGSPLSCCKPPKVCAGLCILGALAHVVGNDTVKSDRT